MAIITDEIRAALEPKPVKKPPWAFTIWSDADNIYAELPAINGHTTHTVHVPNDPDGIRRSYSSLGREMLRPNSARRVNQPSPK